MAHGFYAAHLGYGLIGFRSAGLGHTSAVHVGRPRDGLMRLAIGPQFRSAAIARPVMDHGHHHPRHHPHHPFSNVSCRRAGACEASEEVFQPLSCPLPGANELVELRNNEQSIGCASARKVKAEK